jgi:hypothetical protein
VPGESSPKRDHRDLAALLLAKAAGDEAALEALGRATAVPDEIFGFHAQQAVEKLLKGALAALDREYARTHDLGYLATLLEDVGHRLPDRLVALDELTIGRWNCVTSMRSSTSWIAWPCENSLPKSAWVETIVHPVR